MTLIFEIAAGIVLGVVLLYAAVFLIAWIASWSSGTRLIVAVIFVLLLVAAYNELFPDKKASSDSNTATHRETRTHFAERYKKAHPEFANTPDEELVKQVLHNYPEWCSKVEGGCP